LWQDHTWWICLCCHLRKLQGKIVCRPSSSPAGKNPVSHNFGFFFFLLDKRGSKKLVAEGRNYYWNLDRLKRAWRRRYEAFASTFCLDFIRTSFQ
jgi:hypothetical protein